MEKMNDILKSCEKKRIEGSSPDDDIYVILVLDKNITLLPNLIEQTPHAKLVLMNKINVESINSTQICQWKNLERLRLGGNKLKKLENPFLSECHMLVKLYLYDNEITELASDTFAVLPLLIELDLGDNRIENLHKNLFKSLTNLQSLNLKNNRIQTIDSDLFFHNKELYSIDLSANKIENIPADAFRTLQKLHRLYIKKNPLTDINLKYLTTLKVVNLNDCLFTQLFITSNITYVYANRNQLSHVIVASDSKLKVLRMAFNNFTGLSQLKSLKNLHILDLSNNAIANINFTNLMNFSKLIDLQLKFIAIEDINIIEMMKHLPALKRFNISSDKLSIEHAKQIQYNVIKNNISIELTVSSDRKTNVTSLMKNAIIYFPEIGFQH